MFGGVRFGIVRQGVVRRGFKMIEKLKKMKEIQPPDWSVFCKTSSAKERPPIDPDWWYARTASILRKLNKYGKPIGVEKLRIIYGSKKSKGVKPGHFCKASGKIIRVILQQLESAGLCESAQKGTHKGKIISNKGKKFLNYKEG